MSLIEFPYTFHKHYLMPIIPILIEGHEMGSSLPLTLNNLEQGSTVDFIAAIGAVFDFYAGTKTGEQVSRGESGQVSR